MIWLKFFSQMNKFENPALIKKKSLYGILVENFLLFIYYSNHILEVLPEELVFEIIYGRFNVI